MPLNTKGNSLLSGNVFCGHCGARLVLTTNGKKYVRKTDGEVTITPKVRYVCYNKTRHQSCDGQTGYTTKKLDGIVEEVVKNVFHKLSATPKEEVLEARRVEMLEERQTNLARAKAELKASAAELAEYEAEVIKVIRGTSKLNSNLLNKLHAEAEQKAEEAKQQVAKCEQELENDILFTEQLSQQYDDLISWADMYDQSPMDAKKMIVSRIIKSVRVKRDYELELDMNISYEQFGISL